MVRKHGRAGWADAEGSSNWVGTDGAGLTWGMLLGSAMPRMCTGLLPPVRSCRRGMMRSSSQNRSSLQAGEGQAASG